MLIEGLLNQLPPASLVVAFNPYKPDNGPLKRPGYLTPYSIAPASHGVAAELPGDYSVNQIHRHGSCGAEFELDLINSLVQTLRDDAIQHAHLPKNLRFLKKGYESHFKPGKLTIIGCQQLFNQGVECTYPIWVEPSELGHGTLLSSNVPRVIDSMYFFGLGCFGRKLENKKLLTFHQMPDPVSWITPWTMCPSDWHYTLKALTQAAKGWSDIYLPEITACLNKLLPDIDLTDDDMHRDSYTCAYDLAAQDGVIMVYELDLGMDVGIGYLVPNDSARVMGSVFVNKLIERFTDTSEKVPFLYLEFGCDATILVAIAAMDLNRDDPPVFTRTTLAPKAPNLVSNSLCSQHGLGKVHLQGVMGLPSSGLQSDHSLPSRFDGPQI
ncbi:histidine phosphatase superfamily [Suillus ampliporus]|nr:histidine phosphatase superfamily [Suillus ampliporus]